MNLEEQIIAHIGLKTKIVDPLDIPTIGCGRDLKNRGITHEEAIYLLKNDIKRIKKEFYLELPLLFPALSPVRQSVLIDLAFSLGTEGVMGCHGMLDALAEGDFHRAALEIQNLKWAAQVTKSRVDRLTYMMKYNGEI